MKQGGQADPNHLALPINSNMGGQWGLGKMAANGNYS
jgi:hypothetical protein